jgi:hypothetical protein
VITLTLRPLHPEKSLLYTLKRRLGGPFGEERNLLSAGFEPRVVQPMA